MYRLASSLLLFASFAHAVTPSRTAEIATCIGAFGGFPSPCTLQASSSGALITKTGGVTTTGDTVAFSASSVSAAGSLGGAVAVNSNTSNSSGPGIMVDALEQLVDVITISYGPLNGHTGNMVIYYTLHGTNARSGNNISYACVKIGINLPLFPFGCTAYTQPAVAGTFSGSVHSFTFGTAFPLWFQLESIAGTGFGPARPTGVGSSSANFANTATIAGLLLFDQNMNPLNVTPSVTSALAIPYEVGFPVSIEIKSADGVPSINPKSHGKIPVAVLSTAAFNALMVDTSSLTFGRTGTEHSLSFCNPEGEDVNGDGLLDLVCHFDSQQAGFQDGDTSGSLRGATVTGIQIQGQENISIVP